MGRAPKPVVILSEEKKSHRTKAELDQRKKAEEALLTKIEFKEKRAVKNNPVAHKEFLRVKKLFIAIGKNDGLYETPSTDIVSCLANVKTLRKRKTCFSRI